MPEEIDEKKTDAVSLEEHNKIVGAANTAKAENEELKKQLEELKTEKETNEKETEEKKEWEKVNEDLKTQMEELKKQIEEKDDTKVAKGIVTGNQPKTEETKTIELKQEVKSQLDKLIPDRKVNPEQFGSNINRYLHYRDPTTKQYTDEHLGMGLSLHASAQRIDPTLIPADARIHRSDNVVRQIH